MVSMRAVLVVLLCVACVSLWASGIEATTVYFYATGTENGLVDISHCASWDDARQAEEGDHGTYPYYAVMAWYTGLNHFRVSRGFLSFDTDDLPENVEVTSAELRLYCDSKIWENEYTDSMYVCGGLQGERLDEEDFNKFVGWHSGGGEYNGPIVGRFAWEDVEEDEYITFSLSEASYSWIEAGYAKGALLTDFDFDDIEPPYGGMIGLLEEMVFRAVWPDTAYSARLKVEYGE